MRDHTLLNIALALFVASVVLRAAAEVLVMLESSP